MKVANTATKTKYGFVELGNLTYDYLEYSEYGGSYSTSTYGCGGANCYNSLSSVNEYSNIVGNIIYIPNNITTKTTTADGNGTRRAALYSINGTTTIPAGYYKIKAICNRSAVLANTNIKYNAANPINPISPLIPFVMASWYSGNGANGGFSGESSPDEIKAELSNYIEYLGTSYKVIPA